MNEHLSGVKAGFTCQYDHRNIQYGKFKATIMGAQTITKMQNILLKIATAGVEVDPKFCYYGYDNSPSKELPKISSDVDIPSNPQEL